MDSNSTRLYRRKFWVCSAGLGSVYLILFTLMALILATQSAAAKTETEYQQIPRVVFAFYDSKVDEDIASTNVHQLAELPLNHLGLKVKYNDLQKKMPDLGAISGVRGILIWLTGVKVPNPEDLLRWLTKAMKSGIPVVVIGPHSFERGPKGTQANEDVVSEFWKALGVNKTNEWGVVTYDLEMEEHGIKISAYEREFQGSFPEFPVVKASNGKSRSLLSLVQTGKSSKVSDIVLIGDKGAYIAPNYTHVFLHDEARKYWFIDPFKFFSLAFKTHSAPIPDTTTISGRRIFYSHIDGDGWRNPTRVPKYGNGYTLSSEVILEEILRPYSDFPVTVAPIAADIDPSWFGSESSLSVAKRIFSLPHIEAGSHTYTHPLFWGFFENYRAEYEDVFVDLYSKPRNSYITPGYVRNIPTQTERGELGSSDSSLEDHRTLGEKLQADTRRHYGTPRSYYRGPYSLNEDIDGALDFIKEALPEGKGVKLLQWTGNTRPFKNAIRQTRDANVRNLNGGETRFDNKFDSVSWVWPIGRNIDGEQQIYASMSNENTYTELWTKRYFGFSYLPETLERTETPIRLKPINIYYHMYSGERLSSLNALRRNLDYARAKSLTPITASMFASICDGFYTTTIEKMGGNSWRIRNRGELQTLRFDNATFKSVDFARSEGIVGQTHLHGSLYVSLDPSNEAPVIVIKKTSHSDRESSSDSAYLINGRWPVRRLQQLKNGFEFWVQGYGDGNMSWYLPKTGLYSVQITYSDGEQKQWEVEVDDSHWLDIVLARAPVASSKVTVLQVKESNEGS